MIHVKKNSVPPEKLSSEKCMEQISDVCRNHSEHKAKDNYYAHKTIKEELQKIYGHKCAYCERLTDPATIDHFRPKKRVKERKEYPGYYWLTYEWSNLVLSCGKCNRNKWHNFPVEDESINFPLENESSRVQPPPDLNDRGLPIPKWTDPTEQSLLGGERRLLLNPEWDEDIQTHFFFSPDGKISSETPKGKKSIEVYGLDRNILNISRRQTSDAFLVDIKNGLEDFLNRTSISDYQNSTYDERLYEDIEKVFLKSVWHVEENMPHSAYISFMATHLDDFYINRENFPVNENERLLVINIYQNIRAEYKI